MPEKRRRKGKAEETDSHILLYLSPNVKNRWVAHCLDFDLVGTGADPGEALEELLGVVEVQFRAWAEAVQAGEQLAVPHKAPKKFWNALKRATRLPDIEIKLGDWAERAFRRRQSRFPRPPRRCRQALLTRKEPALA